MQSHGITLSFHREMADSSRELVGLAFAHLLEKLGKGWPVFSCAFRHFDVVQHIAGMGLSFYLIQNFCCGAGPNARQQLDRPKPCDPIPRVLAPSQDTEHILDVGCFQEFEAAILHERNVASRQFNLKLDERLGIRQLGPSTRCPLPARLKSAAPRSEPD